MKKLRVLIAIYWTLVILIFAAGVMGVVDPVPGASHSLGARLISHGWVTLITAAPFLFLAVRGRRKSDRESPSVLFDALLGAGLATGFVLLVPRLADWLFPSLGWDAGLLWHVMALPALLILAGSMGYELGSLAGASAARR